MLHACLSKCRGLLCNTSKWLQTPSHPTAQCQLLLLNLQDIKLLCPVLHPPSVLPPDRLIPLQVQETVSTLLGPCQDASMLRA